MNKSQSLVARAVAAALVGSQIFAVPFAQAATATANITVSATVAANCTISTGAVSFGSYDTLGAGNLDATGSVAIACTKGVGPTITLDAGANNSGGRRMTNGTDFISYELYQPSTTTPGAACAYTQAWNAAGGGIFTPTVAPSKASRSYNVCGRATLGQDVGTGAYTDTVVATVNF
ncbi:MAG: spore coat U domain-containing protein [Burkholderiales bacterium]